VISDEDDRATAAPSLTQLTEIRSVAIDVG